jgi:hypothetical protein
VAVQETSQGHTVWQGLIEVFDLIDHPKAHRCYAWTYQDDEGRMQYAAVLCLPAVQSAHDAVKSAIADPLLTRERTVSFLPNLRDAGYAANFARILKEAEKYPVGITRHDETVAFIVSRERMDAIIETLEILVGTTCGPRFPKTA